jgi:hypothetical protein
MMLVLVMLILDTVLTDVLIFFEGLQDLGVGDGS